MFSNTNRLFETKLIKLIALIFLSELIYSECLILKGEKTSDKVSLFQVEHCIFHLNKP